MGNHLLKTGKAHFQVYQGPIRFWAWNFSHLKLGQRGASWGKHSSWWACQFGCCRIKTSVLGFPFLGKMLHENRNNISEALIKYLLNKWRKLGSIIWYGNPDLSEPVFLSACAEFYVWSRCVIRGNLLHLPLVQFPYL